MANNVELARMRKMGGHNDRQIFSSSDDNAMMKQIEATHSPDGREVDVKPVLFLIEEILHRAIPDIDGVINGTHDHTDTLDDKATVADFDEILEVLAYVIHKISCELSCKCSGGADAHASTMTILSMLSSHKWEAKVVISLAAFTVNYGEFWLVAQLCPTNPLAKSVALLKQMPDIIEHSHSLKSRFDTINNLIKAILDVTKCIIKFKQLPAQYISEDENTTHGGNGTSRSNNAKNRGSSKIVKDENTTHVSNMFVALEDVTNLNINEDNGQMDQYI